MDAYWAEEEARCSFVWMHNVPAHSDGLWEPFILDLTYCSMWFFFYGYLPLRLLWSDTKTPIMPGPDMMLV